MSTETNVVPFNYNGQNLSAVADEQGEIWFVASEVAEILGYAQTNSLNKLLDEDEKRLTTLQIGGNYQNQSLINESGLYNAVFNSTLEGAKAFKKWVTSEVLPTIRKTGQYNPKQTRIAEIDAGIFKLVEGVQKATSQLQEVLEMLLAERKELVQESNREQKRLATVQKKIQAKEDLDLTIAEVRQQELILALQVGKKGALRYQQETGIPMSTTLRDIQKVRLQGYDVRLFDGPFGKVYYLMVDGEPHSGLKHATAADYY